MIRRFAFFGAVGVAVLLMAPFKGNAQFTVDHFAPGDQSYDLVNFGLHGSSQFSRVGDLCANFYTFDHQEIQSCGGCLISGNGSLHEDLRTNLLANTITGVKPASGVVKIVYSSVPASGVCDATASAPTAGLKVFRTKGTSELELSEASLSAAELTRLNSDCADIIEVGSGAGAITCGASD